MAMGLYTYHSESILKTERISRLVENLFAKMPEIESADDYKTCKSI